jgi:hypothetical protein
MKIRLTESKLKQIVVESVKEILNEENFSFMNKEPFYEVNKRGLITKYEWYQKNWWAYTILNVSNENDEWQVDPNKPTKKTGSFRILVPQTMENIYQSGDGFWSLKDAMKESKRRWEEEYPPNALWQVIEIFDNVKVTWKSEPLPRGEAKKLFSRCNNSLYTSYSLVLAK